MPVRNGAGTIGPVLSSVLSQTYRDFRVVVLDDGSTDNTREVVSSFDCDLLATENRGVAAARNRIVAETDSELIAFADADDQWLPDKLERQMHVLQNSGADFVHTDGVYRHPDGRMENRDWTVADSAHAFDHLLPSNRVITSSVLVRRHALSEVGGFPEDAIRCSDWGGWLNLAIEHKFAHLPERLVIYNVLPTSLANAGFLFHQGQYELLTKHVLAQRDRLFRHLPPAAKARYTKMVVRDIGVALSNMSKHKRAQGESREARRLALHALKTSPDVARVWGRALRAFLP